MGVTQDAAWLQWRRNGIGGSDIAAITGTSPWTTRYALWANKVGLTPPTDPTDAMEFGLRAEPMLAQWFHDHTGLYVTATQQQAEHPQRPWQRCTLDGLATETPDGDPIAVIEYKTTSEPAWNEIPDHYQDQAQWAMAVTRLPACWFAVLHIAFGRPQFRTYSLPANLEHQAYNTEQAETFWRDHVCTGIAPDVDGHISTLDALLAQWPDAEGRTEADDSTVELVNDLRLLRADAKELDEAIGLLENRLRAAIGDATDLYHGDNKLATWRWQDNKRTDLAALTADHPELVARYTNVTRSRVLRLGKATE